MSKKHYHFSLFLFFGLLASVFSQQVKPSVFGEHLFQGDFKDESFTGFNPDYQISIGDKIRLQIWGAYKSSEVLSVDVRGNIFIPEIGPVQVLGVRNDDLNQVIRNTIKKVYVDNVEIYANLEGAQPIKVFVSGFVVKPGLYSGFSSDSLLFYLDKAGGIDTQRGSYIDISIVRSGKVFSSVNLYNFLTKGKLEYIQFLDGDLILVNPINDTVTVSGDVNNPYQFEFSQDSISLHSILDIAQVKPNTTHATVNRSSGGKINSSYYGLHEIGNVYLQTGDRVVASTDLKPSTIFVLIRGEHVGPKQLILPYGSRLDAALDQIIPNERSDVDSILLFRKAVAVRQKEMIDQSLSNLEQNILGARSASREEAQLRVSESELLLKFIEKAKKVEPKGQVVLGEFEEEQNVYLEDGDVLHIPSITSLMMVHGEVLFPNTQVFYKYDTIATYIDRAGGFSKNADKSKIIIIHRNGSIENVKKARGNYRKVALLPGDEIMVMPKVNFKSIQLVKDITQILFQIAVATNTIVDFD